MLEPAWQIALSAGPVSRSGGLRGAAHLAPSAGEAVRGQKWPGRSARSAAKSRKGRAGTGAFDWGCLNIQQPYCCNR